MSFFQRYFSPMILIRLVIAIGYIAIGIFILAKPNGLPFLDGAYRIAIVTLFIAYGAFRLYRAINDAKND